jgi:hypothetical protein
MRSPRHTIVSRPHQSSPTIASPPPGHSNIPSRDPADTDCTTVKLNGFKFGRLLSFDQLLIQRRRVARPHLLVAGVIGAGTLTALVRWPSQRSDVIVVASIALVVIVVAGWAWRAGRKRSGG